MLRPAAKLLLVLAALVFWTGAALAHSALLTTSPASGEVLASAPTDLRLTFNEAVSPLSLVLFGPGGTQTDVTAGTEGGPTLVVPLPALPQGTTTLSWHIVSLDGHPVSGALAFSVGAPSAPEDVATTNIPVDIAIWAARTAIYLALFFGVGGMLFAALAPSPPGAHRASITLLVLGLVATPLSLGLQGADALGTSLAGLGTAAVWTTGWSTSYGATVAAALLAIILALLAAITRWRLPAAVALIAAGLSLALSGHASAADPQWLTRSAVFLHVTAIVFWVGALPPLALLLTRGGPDTDIALARFSRVIPWAVAPLVASGVVLAAVQLGWPGPPWFTAYAAILAAKLALLVVLFALAAWNRWRLTVPVLSAEATARRHLRLSVRAELVLVLLILGLVAGWRLTAPPRVIALELAPTATELMIGDIMLDLTIAPGRAGEVTADLVLAMGPPPEEIRLSFAQPNLGIGPIAVDAPAIADGHWQASNVSLPASGLWTVTAELRTGKFELVKADGQFTLN